MFKHCFFLFFLNLVLLYSFYLWNTGLITYIFKTDFDLPNNPPPTPDFIWIYIQPWVLAVAPEDSNEWLIVDLCASSGRGSNSIFSISLCTFGLPSAHFHFWRWIYSEFSRDNLFSTFHWIKRTWLSKIQTLDLWVSSHLLTPKTTLSRMF